MKRVLFVAEAVSLAHVTRPFVLAKALDPRLYEVHFAVQDRYPLDLDRRDIQRWSINSIAPQEFLAALGAGRPIYSERTLDDYVAQELKLLDAVKPDIVVGDFRLSLAVSAPLKRIPYVSVTNAHWSPYSTRKRLPIPEHPLTRAFGPRMAGMLFNLVQPLVLAHHAAPLNRIRAAYGLGKLGGLRDAYTWADLTLYADIPELVTTSDLPQSHRYIGPILWAPDVSVPAGWREPAAEETCVYVTFGSSGQVRALSAVLEGLSALPVVVLLATAGRTRLTGLPDNVRAAEYLPGLKASGRASLVICNGGSATVYQALSQGRPVLGIPSNLDQHLTMSFVADAGAGLSIRAESASPSLVQTSVRTLLTQPSYKRAAEDLGQRITGRRPEELFVAALDSL